MDIEELYKQLKKLLRLAVAMSAFVAFLILVRFQYIDLSFAQEEVTPVQEVEEVLAEGSIDSESGLIVGEGFQVVKTQCGACHSTKLVAQNNLSRAEWKDLIVWMQETQNLWDLGEQEDLILDYLAKQYGPKKIGRRKNLQVEEWYVLE